MNMRLQTGRRGSRRLVPGLALAAAAVTAFPAAAQVVGEVGSLSSQTLFFDQAQNLHGRNYLDAEAGLVGTDNATLAPNSPGDVLALLGLAADTYRTGAGLDYHLDADLALIKYLREHLPTKPSGYLDGGADLKIVPGVLSWTARETYTNIVVNALDPVTPENLETLNYITTGPRLTLRPTLRTTVTLDATYSVVNSGSVSASYVDLDNHRYGGDVRIDHALTGAASVYFSGSSVHADFTDQTANTNFTQTDAFVGFRFLDARTVVDISGGVDWLRAGAVTPTAGAFSVQLSRLITPHQRISLHALRQLTDSANLLRLTIDQPVASNASLEVAAGDPMTFRTFGADWRFEASRTALTLAVTDNTQRYRLNPNLDNEIKVADILLTRQLRPTLELSVGMDYQHQDFASGVPTHTVNVLASLRWQVGERLGLRLAYAHNTFSVIGDRYQVGLILYYGLIPPTPPGTEPGAPSGPVPSLLPTSPMSTQAPPH